MYYVKHYWAWGSGRAGVDIFRLAGGHEAERLVTISSSHKDWDRLSQVAAQAICDRLDREAAELEDLEMKG